MLAIVLHKPGVKLYNLQKELQYEHIQVDGKLWEPGKPVPQDIFEASVVIVACVSPDCEILEIMPELRRKKHTLPIVVKDNVENINTKMRSYSLGADAYFAEPIIYSDFTMALKNLVAKKEALNNGNRWIRGFDVWLDRVQRFAKRNNHKIPLRNKEYALLEFFLLNRGKILTRNCILEHVWDRNANFASNTVDVHINRLRRKLDDPFREKLIHTIPCIGYVFDKRNTNR